jgi:hypothetical protein
MHARGGAVRVGAAFGLALLLAACAAQPQTREASPERAVEDTFEAYRTALLARDGATAADLVTAETWAYYREMGDVALTADEAELRNMDFVDRLTGLLFRHALTVEDLQALSGEELVAVSIDHGWISRDRTAGLTLVNYTIEGDTATAYSRGRDGKPTKSKMTFYQERGAWRIHLLDNIKQSRSTMKLAIALSGMTEEQLLFESLKRGVGRPAGPEIWEPPA